MKLRLHLNFDLNDLKNIDFRQVRHNIRLRFTPEDELAENRLMIIGENCASSIVSNLIGGNFFTGLLLMLNADTVQIGLVNILTYIANLCQLFSPLLLERFASRKKILIWSRVVIHILNIIMIGLVGALPFEARLRVTIILGFVAILNAVSGLTSPGFSVWHMQSVPERERANYYSLNQRAVNLAAYIFILAGSSFADFFKAHGMELQGYLILRGVAVLFAIWDIWLLARIKEYDYPKGEPLNLKKLITEPLKAKKYMTSVLIVFLWNFFATTNGSYYSVYMLQTLNVSYSFLNLVGAMYVPCVMILAPIWARYINRTSWLSVFWKTLILYGIFYLGHSYVTASCLWLYPVVVLCCYLISPGLNLVNANMAFYNIPRENQTVYLSFCSAASMVAAILGNLFATRFMLIFEDHMFRMFGVDMYPGQFLVSITGALIILLGVIVFFIERREIAEKKRHPEQEETY